MLAFVCLWCCSYLGFDHTATLFHIRDSPVDPVVRPIFLTNAFSFAICIHNVSLPEEAKTMFSVSVSAERLKSGHNEGEMFLIVVSLFLFQGQNFSAPIVIPPHESRYIFSLLFRPVRPSIHIDSNILLITNASKFHLPVRAYTGFLEVQSMHLYLTLFIGHLFILEETQRANKSMLLLSAVLFWF